MEEREKKKKRPWRAPHRICVCFLSFWTYLTSFDFPLASERFLIGQRNAEPGLLTERRRRTKNFFFFFFLNLVDYTTRYMIWPGGGDWLPTVSILCPVSTSPLLLFPRVPVARITEQHKRLRNRQGSFRRAAFAFDGDCCCCCCCCC